MKVHPKYVKRGVIKIANPPIAFLYADALIYKWTLRTILARKSILQYTQDKKRTISIIFQMDEQFYEINIEISRLNILNTNCMENMAWMIRDLWYIFLRQMLVDCENECLTL